MLRRAVGEGSAVLSDLALLAVSRLVQQGPQAVLSARSLFSAAEKKDLAEALAATNATAELLGRSRIRLRQARAEEQKENFSENDSTDFTAFDEGDPEGGVKPLAPEAALDYFRNLVPRLSIDPQRWGEQLRRDAFTLAGATDEQMLSRVQDVIRKRLETGEGIGSAPREIRALLDQAGVSPRNSYYGDMVFRTNMMDAFTTGGESERMHPDVIETFPVWRYLGIRDGRQGTDHEPHFDKYYPARVTFHEVRGKRVFSCRCTPQAISKWRWAKLRAAGARIADGYEDVPAKFGEAALQEAVERLTTVIVQRAESPPEIPEAQRPRRIIRTVERDENSLITRIIEESVEEDCESM